MWPLVVAVVAASVAADTCTVIHQCGDYYSARTAAWGPDGTCCAHYRSDCCVATPVVATGTVLLLVAIIAITSWFCCCAPPGCCHCGIAGHSHSTTL
jgi:hypothetical protein